MIIHQISGFTNSGKTTIITGLITSLQKQGYRVATIKHHGHQDPLVKEANSKDASKHRLAGAEASLVSSAGGELQLIAHQMKEELSLDQLISLYEPFEFDIILIEGYKQADYPKTFVMRKSDTIQACSAYPAIKAIISPEHISYDSAIPVFLNTQLETYYDWFITEILKDDDNE